MPEAIRVMVVDDEPIIGEGIRSIIDQSESMRFVGAVASPDELFAALGATHCDVIIMDYLISDDDCGDPDGLYLLRQIRVSHPGVRIILYTSLARAGLLESAKVMGADAILCKRDPLDVLMKTIQVLGGGSMRVAPMRTADADAGAFPDHAGAVGVAGYLARPVAAASRTISRADEWALSRRSEWCGESASGIGHRGTGGTTTLSGARPGGDWDRAASAATTTLAPPVTAPATIGAARRDPLPASRLVLARESPRRAAPVLRHGAGPPPMPPGRLPYDAVIRCPDVSSDPAAAAAQGVWLENRLSLTRLSPRETEIVRLLSNGRSLKEVAAYVGRSPKTISNQKRSAMLKLGLHSDIDLLRFAMEAGLS